MLLSECFDLSDSNDFNESSEVRLEFLVACFKFGSGGTGGGSELDDELKDDVIVYGEDDEFGVSCSGCCVTGGFLLNILLDDFCVPIIFF